MSRFFTRLQSLLLLAFSGLFFLPLGSHALWDSDEGRYAEIAREMALPGGDWLTPHLNGIPHFQKPPLLYWCTAVSLKVFGAQPWAARLPVVFAALGTLALAAWLARTLLATDFTGRPCWCSARRLDSTGSRDCSRRT